MHCYRVWRCQMQMHVWKYWQFCWQESHWLHNWISRLCNARVQQTEEFTLPPRWIYPDRRDSASCYAMDSLNHPAFGSCKLFHREKSLGFGLSYCIHSNALGHRNFNFALVMRHSMAWAQPSLLNRSPKALNANEGMSWLLRQLLENPLKHPTCQQPGSAKNSFKSSLFDSF